MPAEEVMRCYRDLFLVAMVDDELAPAERVLLDDLRDRLGLFAAEAEAIERQALTAGASCSIELPSEASARRGLFATFCQLTAADMRISHAERRLLLYLKRQLRLSEDEFLAQLPEALWPAFAWPYKDRARAVTLLAAAAMIDGAITAEEQRVLEDAAGFFDVPVAEVNELVEEMRHSPDMKLRLPNPGELADRLLAFARQLLGGAASADPRNRRFLEQLERHLTRADEPEPD